MNSNFLKEDILEVVSKTAGSYDDDGIYQEGVSSSKIIKANIQPHKEYVIDREGLKRLQKTGNIIIYSTELLKVSDYNQTADFVIYNNRIYEILEIEHWKGITQEFYKYLGVLRNANT
jgi:hypothetical protein